MGIRRWITLGTTSLLLKRERTPPISRLDAHIGSKNPLAGCERKPTMRPGGGEVTDLFSSHDRAVRRVITYPGPHFMLSGTVWALTPPVDSQTEIVYVVALRCWPLSVARQQTQLSPLREKDDQCNVRGRYFVTPEVRGEMAFVLESRRPPASRDRQRSVARLARPPTAGNIPVSGAFARGGSGRSW